MQRPHYTSSHWARDINTDSALSKYLLQYKSPYSALKVNIFKQLLPSAMDGLAVLDYGGGIGYLSRHCLIEGAHVTLVDAEASALRAAHRWMADHAGCLSCICSDEFPKALEGEHFHVAILKDVLEHVFDDIGLLRRVAGAQNKGDILIVSTQNKRSLNAIVGLIVHGKTWKGWDETHLRFYNVGRLRAMLTECAYQVEKLHGIYLVPYGVSRYRTWWGKPLAWASTAIDVGLGGIWPFNSWAWNIIVKAKKK